MLALAAAQSGVSASSKPKPAPEARSSTGQASHGQRKIIPGGARIWAAPAGGFEAVFTTALETKKVPVFLVPDRVQADYEAVFPQDEGPGIVINIVDIRTGGVLLTCRTRKKGRPAAEECASRLKEAVIEAPGARR